MLKYQDKNQIRKNKKFFKKTVFLFLFFIITALGAWSFLGGPVNIISRPLLLSGNWISQGFDNLGFYFNSKESLSKENDFLTEENFSLKARLENYEIIEKENLDLKQTLNRIKEPQNYILANILTKPNRSLYDSVILDIGKNHNVEIEDTAYAYGEIPIGRISEVYENSSLLTLFTSPGLKTEGFIDEVNASVELIGRGGGNFETVIPIDLILPNGTKVYIPGYDARVLARIIETISSPSDPFKKVILNSPVNIESLKWVQVRIK
ncbi:MAG: rod shape-determining protein MreC [Candidatus Moranbacteria bacterium]|nr:rod shape-determining protein MreC [Candidatus Moranbacteria bacterium]